MKTLDAGLFCLGIVGFVTVAPFYLVCSVTKREILRVVQKGKDYKAAQRFIRLTRIEKTANATITIATTASPKNLAKCHPQDQSPIFKLPPEIRIKIFAFATAQTVSEAQKLSQWDHSCHPQCSGPLVACTAILQTCRRSWLEACHLPLQQAEIQCFKVIPWEVPHWIKRPRRYRDGRHLNQSTGLDGVYMSQSTNRLTPFGHECLTTVRLFQHVGFLTPLSMCHWHHSNFVAPRTLIMTVPSTGWSKAGTLEIEQEWLWNFLNEPISGQMREFRLELETEEEKSSQLLFIVEQLRLTKTEERMALGVEEERRPGNGERWRWVLLPSLPVESWSLTNPRGQIHHYCRMTLVWKNEEVMPACPVEAEWKPVAKESSTPLPNDTKCHSEDSPEKAKESRQAQVRWKWANKWEEQGSLLKFLES